MDWRGWGAQGSRLRLCLWDRGRPGRAVDVVDNADGTQGCSTVPSREGPYSISVLYGKREVTRRSRCCLMMPARVKASGPGLNTTGVPASLPVEFTIDAKDAGEGLLAVQITDPEGKPKKTHIQDNHDGTYTVAYVPDVTEPLHHPHQVWRRWLGISPQQTPLRPQQLAPPYTYAQGGRPDLGSPLQFYVDPSSCGHVTYGPGLNHGVVNKPAVFTVNTKDAGEGDDSMRMSHLKESHSCPRETGEHLVHVKNGQHVASSPIPVVISQSEIGDASRVRGLRQGLHEATPSEPAEFIADTRDAGYGGLSLSIEGSPKIITEDLEDGTCRVTYCPTEPGNYIINIKFADQHVAWQPLLCEGDRREGRVKESITGQPGPIGDYEVSVKFNEEHIPDSPVACGFSVRDARRLTVSSLQVRHWEKPPALSSWAGQTRATAQKALALCPSDLPSPAQGIGHLLWPDAAHAHLGLAGSTPAHRVEFSRVSRL
ncbi:Filamin-A [Manis pentadactyla]|nr:Filamin-A [Manis pentadactyla]